ncbi:hypothetical protein [Hoeflea sp.]|uniref:hypothetical protein n=1 Tax=Hoeflea sp. TaxID=1940281 RepID=UPI003749626C
MSSALPITSIISAYAGSKSRQIKRDAAFAGFVSLMAFLACLALLAAFAAFVAETQGPVIGLLSAAGLAIALGVVALAIRSWLRARERRRHTTLTAGTASALAASSASTMIAQNKTLAIAAGLAIGLIAGSAVRPRQD